MNLLKNLKTMVFLALMSASVSTQGSALLGTWEANYDLTIPSSETLSISHHDSKAKREIMMGYECCYRQELLDAVRMDYSLKSMQSRLRENPKLLRSSRFDLRWELVDPPSEFDWTVFVTLQVLDIYTTYRGLKYDCVEEANPLFGKRPSVSDMALYKFAILTPAFQYDKRHGNLSKASLRGTNTFMMFVIGNNLNVVQRADSRCQKR